MYNAVLNQRGFTSIENRMTALENRMLDDLKEFFKILTEHDKRINVWKIATSRGSPTGSDKNAFGSNPPVYTDFGNP